MIKNLFIKYKDIIYYGIFGILSTIVNIAVYWFIAHPLGVSTIPSSIVAWIACVTFAYLTNRRLVFHSEAEGAKEIIKEIIYFYLCRLGTGFIDWGLMYLTVDILGWNDMLMKLLINILVIITNYIASKLIIFRHKEKDIAE